MLYESLKKPSVLHHKIWIRVVFYHQKVILEVSDEYFKKLLKKVKTRLYFD
jgi:hypothetical protein